MVNQANFLFGYEAITMIIVLVTTKEKSLGTDFNQENWMLVIWLRNYFFQECYWVDAVMLSPLLWLSYDIQHYRITSFLSLPRLPIWTKVGTKGCRQILWLKYGKNVDVDYCWSFLSWGAVISKTLLNLPRLLTYFALGHLHTYLLHTYCIHFKC